MGRKRRSRFSVRTKIAFALLAVTVAASIAQTANQVVQAKAHVLQGYATEAPFVADVIASQYEASFATPTGLSNAQRSLSVRLVSAQLSLQNYLKHLVRTVPGLYQVRLFQAVPPTVWMTSDETDFAAPLDKELVRSGLHQFSVNIAGVPGIETVVPVPHPGPPGVVSIALVHTMGQERAAVTSAIRDSVIGSAAVIAVELLVLFPIFEVLVLRRLRRLGRAAAAVRTGDLSVHLPEGDQPPGRDEVANVAREFDSMVRTIEDKTRQQEAVTVLGQHALEGLSLPDLFQEATALVAEHMEVEYSAVMELIEGDLLVTRVGVGWEGQAAGAPTTEAGHNPQAEFTLRNFVPVVVEDFDTETRFGRSPLQLERGIVSSATVVIPGQTRPFGVLSADSRERQFFTEEQLSFLQFVAGVLAGWIERRQAEEQVTFMAYHDKLTGLPNRAMLEEHLALALARADRSGLACAVLFLDLDDFKVVNDTMGHAAGDELLRQMSGRLGDATRDVDLIARQGGDEFLVLLADLEKGSGSDEAARAKAEAVAVSVARRIQENLEPEFELGQSRFTCSASVGVSVYPFDATDVTTLLKNADAAMYRSKNAGHGLFCVHGSDSPQG